MQVLDRAGVGTLWSICKTKFALAGHTHSSVTDGTMTIYPMANNEVNFGGSNNSATIYFGYRAKDSKPIPTNFVFGGSTGTATLTAAKFKGALEGNASTASNASKVNGHTVNSDVPSGAKFTDTNTWRGIQDNLTSTSTSESLSANQGKVLKGLVDGKANSSHTHSWSQISGVPTATTTQSGIMSAADKAKLNGIASGANNYSLPVSSNTTLGGIKVSMPAQDTGTRWPIILDNNGVAYTSINGLNKNNLDGSVENVIAKNNKYSTTYSSTKIQIRDMSQNKSALLDFPAKSGIFALLSDIPDASNLCRFNFINSISECKSDRINFLFKIDNSNVDLSHLYNFGYGTILFIYSPHFGYEITCKSDTWYYYGNSYGAGDTDYVNSGILRLAFLYKGYVYLCSFNEQ